MISCYIHTVWGFTHTRMWVYGGYSALIYTTCLSSVFLWNKFHPPTWKQERPSVSLFYLSDRSLLQFGANCSGVVLPCITVTYIPLINSSFHNLSGLHFHTKGCSPPSVPDSRITPRALCSHSLCGFRGWRLNLSLISCFEPKTCGHTVLSVSFVPLFHFCLFNISTLKCSDSRSGTFRPSGCEYKWSCSLMRQNMWINLNETWQMTCAPMVLETQRQGHWRGKNVCMLTQADPLVLAKRWADFILPEHLWEGHHAASENNFSQSGSKGTH